MHKYLIDDMQSLVSQQMLLSLLMNFSKLILSSYDKDLTNVFNFMQTAVYQIDCESTKVNPCVFAADLFFLFFFPLCVLSCFVTFAEAVRPMQMALEFDTRPLLR